MSKALPDLDSASNDDVFPKPTAGAAAQGDSKTSTSVQRSLDSSATSPHPPSSIRFHSSQHIRPSLHALPFSPDLHQSTLHFKQHHHPNSSFATHPGPSTTTTSTHVYAPPIIPVLFRTKPKHVFPRRQERQRMASPAQPRYASPPILQKRIWHSD